MKNLVTFTILLLITSNSFALDITGKVLERGTRNRLAEISVFLIPKSSSEGSRPIKLTTNETGVFFLKDAPLGEVEWVVNLPGYLKLQKLETLSESSRAEVILYVEKNKYQAYETTVFGKGVKKDDTARSLKASQIAEIPGSGNDPIKAVQNLPGVNRAPAFGSQVIIQGSAPQDTRYHIDGHEVPIIFHFGGFSSVLSPDAIDRVDYLSAGYGPENGRANGGLVGAWSRAPRSDRQHGMAFMDVINAGATLEGPISEKSRYLVSGRRSYIGNVLKAVLPKTGGFDFTAAPAFQDLSVLYEYDFSKNDQFRILNIGSMDTFEFVLNQPSEADPSFRGNFFTRTAFFRSIPQYTHVFSENLKFRSSVGFGRDWITFDTTDNYFKLQTYSLTPRVEVDWESSALSSHTFGFDNLYNWAGVDVLLPKVSGEGGVQNPFSSGEKQQVSVKAKFSNIGLFAKNSIQLGSGSPVTLLPSLRGDYYSSTKETLALPRLGVRYQVNPSLQFRVGSGFYAQPPQPQEVDSSTGNPEVKASRAKHFSLGAEKDFREGAANGIVASTSTFYKDFNRLIVPSSKIVKRENVFVSENFNNSGLGNAFGIETLLKLEGNPWSGWISYTLSKSTRWNETDTTPVIFGYDQTHLLTAIVAYEFEGNWKVGLRSRYATGNPTTPITAGIFDADNDVYYPVRGAFYSQRLDSFFQTDLRVDKKWIYNTWMLSAYLDIQNVTNRKNLEALQYAYDYSSSTKVAGLPIIPSLGVKAEF